MGFLRRLVGRPPDRRGPPAHPPSEAFQWLLAEPAQPSLHKQLHLADVIGDEGWLLDQDAATITFGDKTFAAQLLGTESTGDGSWLWAWAKPRVVQGLTRDATTVREFGEQRGIEELTTPKVAVGGALTGETLSMIATQVVDADAFYCGQFEGGAASSSSTSPQVPRAHRKVSARAWPGRSRLLRRLFPCH